MVDYGMSAGPAATALSLDFVMPDLRSSSFQLNIGGKAYSNQTPYFEWAICDVSTDHCPAILSTQGNPSPKDDITIRSFQGSVNYKGWTLGLNVSMPLNTYLPSLFPIDSYATPRFYISTNSEIALHLISMIPQGFIVTFEDLRPVNQNNLPQDLQTKELKNFDSWLTFVIGMIRSPSELVLDNLYALPPLLSMYYVAILSYSLNARKDRLTVYVGVLFSAFAFLLTLRQFLPPSPTFFEAFVVLGMLVWIFREMAIRVDPCPKDKK